MQNDPLTERVIGCCFKIHRQLGPGLPEKIYHNALRLALKKAGLNLQSGKRYSVSYEDTKVGEFQVDLLIEDRVVLEVKAVTGMMPKVFEAQVLAYLKAARLPIGLLVNFGNKSCQIRRLVASSL